MQGHVDTCKLNCEIPDGFELTEMPPSRHDWSDILRCPNTEVCGRTFLVKKFGKQSKV